MNFFLFVCYKDFAKLNLKKVVLLCYKDMCVVNKTLCVMNIFTCAITVNSFIYSVS